MLAETAVNEVKPEVVVPAPKQTKLLGATVKGVGLITTVSVQNVWRWALIERPDGTEAHVFLADLKKEQLIMPEGPQPYREVRRRVGYGLWEDVYELELVELSDLTHDTAVCPECGGAKRVEICSACKTVPTVRGGVDVCGCVFLAVGGRAWGKAGMLEGVRWSLRRVLC